MEKPPEKRRDQAAQGASGDETKRRGERAKLSPEKAGLEPIRRVVWVKKESFGGGGGGSGGRWVRGDLTPEEEDDQR